MPSHAGRGQIAPTGRWRQRKMRSSMSPQVVEEAAKKRVDGTEAALAALAAVGTTGPEVSMLTACLQKARRFSTRTTNRCAVEPAGVCCREGEEAFDRPTRQLASNSPQSWTKAKPVKHASKMWQLRLHQLRFQTWEPRCSVSNRY